MTDAVAPVASSASITVLKTGSVTVVAVLQIEVHLLSAFARGDAADHLRAVFETALRMEHPGLAGMPCVITFVFFIQ